MGQNTVNITTCEEKIGRCMYVAGALLHDRPFLAPLYKIHGYATTGLNTTDPVKCLQACTSADTASAPRSYAQLVSHPRSTPRLSQSAREPKGGCRNFGRTAQCPLWSLLRRAGRGCSRMGGKPSLVISTFCPDESEIVLRQAPCGPPHTCTIRADTDRQSVNGKMTTTSYPSGAVLMELACSSRGRP